METERIKQINNLGQELLEEGSEADLHQELLTTTLRKACLGYSLAPTIKKNKLVTHLRRDTKQIPSKKRSLRRETKKKEKTLNGTISKKT